MVLKLELGKDEDKLKLSSGGRTETEGISSDVNDVTSADEFSINITKALAIISLTNEGTQSGNALNVYDDDVTTGWGASYSNVGAPDKTFSVTYDLGKIVYVHNCIVIYTTGLTGAAAGHFDSTISYSTDNSTYSNFSGDGTSTNAGTAVVYTAYAAKRNIRYIKITFVLDDPNAYTGSSVINEILVTR